jgi:hypothetical protein
MYCYRGVVAVEPFLPPALGSSPTSSAACADHDLAPPHVTLATCWLVAGRNIAEPRFYFYSSTNNNLTTVLNQLD